jgi:hypothetical protein
MDGIITTPEASRGLQKSENWTLKCKEYMLGKERLGEENLHEY